MSKNNSNSEHKSHSMGEMLGDHRSAGLFVEKNKLPIFSVVAIILIAVIMWGLQSHFHAKFVAEKSNAIYEFSAISLEKFKAEDVSADAFVDEFNRLMLAKLDFTVYVPLIYMIYDILVY